MSEDDARRLNVDTAARLAAYMALEEALCPTGMNFTEYINDLNQQIAKAQSPVREQAHDG